jgi:hypothetical protein
MTIKPRHILMALPVVFIAWIGVLAGVMRITGEAPAALVMLPPDGFLARLPPGVAVTARGSLSVTVRSDDPGLVAALYGAGAPLVLPAGLTGCFPKG